jgi:hypothetical protein
MLAEIGDAAWSLLKLCNERGLDLEELVGRTLARLESGRERRLGATPTTSFPLLETASALGRPCATSTRQCRIYAQHLSTRPTSPRWLPHPPSADRPARAVVVVLPKGAPRSTRYPPVRAGGRVT